jgi:SAM-dependent methyltransferase
MALWDLFLNHTGRVIHKWTHYFPVYEQYFSEYVGKPLVFLEIGCGKGGSLQMWKKYFGPHAIIIGIDIKPKCKKFEEEQINIRIGSQSDIQFLGSIVEEFGLPDIVLDDGSHRMSDILASFNHLYPKTDKRGIYIVEDLHTAYWEEYEGGLRKDGTFIEKCKYLIDELNAEHSRGKVGISDFTKTTLSIHFYDSMVVFKKGTYGKKYAPQIGNS